MVTASPGKRRIDADVCNNQSNKWCLLTHDQSKVSYPPGFTRHNVIMTGNGMPYEAWRYFLSSLGYQYELRPEEKMEFEALLMGEDESTVSN